MEELSNGLAGSIRMCLLYKLRFVDIVSRLLLRARGVLRRDLCNDIAQI